MLYFITAPTYVGVLRYIYIVMRNSLKFPHNIAHCPINVELFFVAEKVRF